jgi:hypothetical protein
MGKMEEKYFKIQLRYGGEYIAGQMEQKDLIDKFASQEKIDQEKKVKNAKSMFGLIKSCIDASAHSHQNETKLISGFIKNRPPVINL